MQDHISLYNLLFFMVFDQLKYIQSVIEWFDHTQYDMLRTVWSALLNVHFFTQI